MNYLCGARWDQCCPCATGACRTHLESLEVDVASYADLALLADRVAAWQDKLQPILDAQERDREPFDMLAIGRDIVNKLAANKLLNHKPQKVKFLDVTKDAPRYRVCRTFLATLQLANNGRKLSGGIFSTSLTKRSSSHGPQ